MVDPFKLLYENVTELKPPDPSNNTPYTLVSSVARTLELLTFNTAVLNLQFVVESLPKYTPIKSYVPVYDADPSVNVRSSTRVLVAIFSNIVF